MRKVTGISLAKMSCLTLCLSSVSLIALTVDAQAQYRSRSLLPDRPSVEVNMEVIDQLRHSAMPLFEQKFPPAMPFSAKSAKNHAPALVSSPPAPPPAAPAFSTLPPPVKVPTPSPSKAMMTPVPAVVAPVVPAPLPVPSVEQRNTPVDNPVAAVTPPPVQPIVPSAAPAPLAAAEPYNAVRAQPPVSKVVGAIPLPPPPPPSRPYSTYQFGQPEGRPLIPVPSTVPPVKPIVKAAPIAKPKAQEPEKKVAKALPKAPEKISPPAEKEMPKVEATKEKLPDLPPIPEEEIVPAPNANLPLPEPEIGAGDFESFPELEPLPDTVPVKEEKLPEIAGSPKEKPEEDAIPDLPEVEPTVPSEMQQEDVMPEMPDLPEAEPTAPSEVQQDDAGLPEVPDLTSPDAAPDLSLPPAEEAPPSVPEANALPDLGALTGETEAVPTESVDSSLPPLDSLTQGSPQESELPALPEIPAPAEEPSPPLALPEIGESIPPIPDLPAETTTEQGQQIASLPEVGSMPSLETPAEEPSASKTVTIEYPQTDTSLPVSSQQVVDSIIDDLVKNDRSVKIIGYASGQANAAKRAGLARAVGLRAYLIDKGVKSINIITSSKGSESDGGSPERVDIIIQ